MAKAFEICKKGGGNISQYDGGHWGTAKAVVKYRL